MPRSLLLLAVAALLAQPCLAAVTFDWAYVGNADNAADPQTGLGAISYNYAIAKHEVTNAQYVEFLNAIDATGANTRTLYNPDMAGNFGGIENTGTFDGARYILKAGRAQNPVTYVSFFDAMRFTNWLHNGQGSGDTETGAYVIGDGLNEVRSTSAKYWIPSENEWYKAAYHDAAVGTAGTYFDYANGSNSEPISDRPGDNPAAMNFVNNDGRVNGFNDGYAVSGIGNFPSDTNPYTDVGAYTEAASPYGTFDQNGNVSEWTEAVFIPAFRGHQGGWWNSGSLGLRANRGGITTTTGETANIGFRLATIPEPTSLALAAMLTFSLVGRRR